MSEDISLDRIRSVYEAIAPSITRTPTLPARALSEQFGCTLYLKCEMFQRTGSFKDRGALAALLHLTEAQKSQGVITASAGNHAQGLSWHGQRLGVPTTVLMPEHTPFTKLERTRAFGAEVELYGETLDDCTRRMGELIEERGLTCIHPFDDDEVICGQGSVALEMLADVPDLDVLFVPVGGGGLISGTGIVSKALRPDIELIGVEVSRYASAHNSVRGTSLPIGGGTLAEGIAVKSPGERNLRYIRRYVDDLMLVEEADIESAIYELLNGARLLAEGAGAAGFAAFHKVREKYQGKNVGIVLCGGNIDMRLASSVILRQMIVRGFLASLRIGIQDRPGVLAHVSDIVGSRGANIVEISHHRLHRHLPVKEAELGITVETRGASHVQELVQELRRSGYQVSEDQNLS